MYPFIQAIRQERIETGEKIKKTRTTMANIGG